MLLETLLEILVDMLNAMLTDDRDFGGDVVGDFETKKEH